MPPGFYLIRFATGGTSTISYQGDQYTCPYDPAFPDTGYSFPFCVQIPVITSSLYAGASPLYPSTYPNFYLGYRNTGDTVRIEIRFKRRTTLPPDSFKLILKDILDNNVAPQPADLNVDIPIPAGGLYVMSFTIGAVGRYYLEVEMVGAMQALEIYNIVGTTGNGITLFNSMDVLRTKTDLLKYIYLGTPGLIKVTNSRGENYINLYAITNPTSSFDIGPLQTPNTVTTNKNIYYTLPSGYYVAVFQSSAVGIQADISIQSNAFTCPFNISIVDDPRSIFQACTNGTMLNLH